MKKKVVLKHFGGVTATARALGITRSAVAQWRDTIPELAAVKLAALTNGKLRYNPALYARRPAA